MQLDQGGTFEKLTRSNAAGSAADFAACLECGHGKWGRVVKAADIREE